MVFTVRNVGRGLNVVDRYGLYLHVASIARNLPQHHLRRQIFPNNQSVFSVHCLCSRYIVRIAIMLRIIKESISFLLGDESAELLLGP